MVLLSFLASSFASIYCEWKTYDSTFASDFNATELQLKS